MAITRSQIARQLLAEGGAPNPRKPFQSGDLAARDDSYGTLSGGESPASTGGDNEMVFDQRFQDIVTAPETVGFTRGSDAAEFIKSNLTKGLGLITKQPGIGTTIDILRNIFPDTGQTYVRGVDRFGTGDEDETNRFRNRIVQPMMPMTPKLPSDIEPQRSDMQEFVQRFTLPERFRLSGGGITGTETAMKEARQAYDKYKKSGGTLSFNKFIALGDEGVAKFFAEGGRTGFEGSPELAGQGTQTAETYGGPPGGDNEGPGSIISLGGNVPKDSRGDLDIATLQNLGYTGKQIADIFNEYYSKDLGTDTETNVIGPLGKTKDDEGIASIGMNTKNTPRVTSGYEIKSGMPGSAENKNRAFQKMLDEYYPRGLADGGPIRQAYGLGSLVKSITKPVKKVLKSDVGKAALAAAAVYYAPAVFGGTTGFGPGTTYGNFLRGPAKNFLFGTPFNAPDAVTGGATKGGLLNFLKSPRGAATAILGTSALAGAITPEEEVESLSSRISDRTGIDVEAIRKEVQAAYASGDLSGLKSKYPFLIPTEAARAEGGRIGFDEGGKDLSSDPNYRGWVKIYETDPELAKMNDNHGRYLEFYNSQKKAEGGRIGAEEGGLMNLGGNEMDLRGGGFVPIGVAEKADDVPARLSKNEFVFTADAVRAAGGGSVDRGADLMYKTMKQLENQVA
jgi:hypothetical protein